MIQESTYIERLKEDEKNIDFESIRKEGIQLLQELSGKIWTDYNIHDPGVTILEQLIYALTELIYLSDFDVKDILTPEDNEIKYSSLALYKPLEIFPSETITHNDYCKTIFDKIEGIRNIWIYKKDGSNKGLYNFLIDISRNFLGKENELIDKVKKVYNENRNLCEDIDNIEVLKREPIEVCGIIEVNNNQSPDDILADIFFRCFKVISPRIVLHSYRNLRNTDLSLEEILSGPEIVHGYIRENEMLPPKQSIYVSELMKEIYQINGVESIVDFHIEKEGKKFRSIYSFDEPIKGGYVRLPSKMKELKISVRRNNRECSLNISEVVRKFYKRVHHYKSIFNTSQDIADLYSMPKGNYANFENYYSIQNHFPAIYGINQYGVPPGATPERKAKAKQLKAYLMLFEQVMVNFLSQLENIKELFSIESNKKITYFTKALTEIPDSKELLTDKWKTNTDIHKLQLKQIIAKYDNFYERKNRVLDYILAMYGERFTQKTFQQFNYYHTPKELSQILCDNKIFFLKYLVSINRYKARSFNYYKPSWNTLNIPMIKLKASLLLGIKDFLQTSYSDVLANYNLTLINETTSGECADCIYKKNNWNIELDNDYINENFSNIPEFTETEHIDPDTIKNIAKEIEYIKDGILCEDFFRYGINLNLYKVGKLKRRNTLTVVFKHPNYENYIYIGDFKNQTHVTIAINCLRKFLILLNKQSEGMHIVEHILLHQENPDYVFGTHITNDKDEIIFTSGKDYFKYKEEHITHDLKDILHDHRYYTIEETEEQMFNISIWKDRKKILTGNSLFDSADEAEKSIEEFLAYFKALYEIDIIHHKIKPFKFPEVSEDFYPFRISIILPSWSARFHNKRFQKYLEETVRLNLPAHIYPEFFWLDMNTLNEFEELYKNWLKTKATNDNKKMEEHSGSLIKFLLKIRKAKK